MDVRCAWADARARSGADRLAPKNYGDFEPDAGLSEAGED